MEDDLTFKGSLMENLERFKRVFERYKWATCSVEFEDLDDLLKLKKVEISGRWHLNVLNGKRVVGVDGSQISPLRELGIPIGAVQVAKIWVVHGRGEFGKDYRTTFVRVEDNIDLKRFQMELEMLMEEMDGKSWLFFDGSLIPHSPDQTVRERMERIVSKVLEKSEETRTPIIGYIDKSFSKDIAKMLGVDIYDAFILSKVMDMFTYTRPMGNGIVYSYVRVNPMTPVRIEYPEWMRDMHEEVVRVVIAECLLGRTKGYPYILERAHRYSHIDSKTRASFMKAVKSFGISFKWISKIA